MRMKVNKFEKIESFTSNLNDRLKIAYEYKS